MCLWHYALICGYHRSDGSYPWYSGDRSVVGLPRYFENAVGELSQRLVTNIEGLAGTALSVCQHFCPPIFGGYVDVLPFLSAISVHFHCMCLVPVLRPFIRADSQRAVATARTQSHLIEILGGIQTVKAQHSNSLLAGSGKIVTAIFLKVLKHRFGNLRRTENFLILLAACLCFGSVWDSSCRENSRLVC